ncbi:MAG: tetratricopeptide repeat protein [Bacteroidota bacterium]
MKIYSFIFLLIFFTSAGTYSCSSSDGSSENSQTANREKSLHIANLLDRPAGLQVGQEWQQVSESFQALALSSQKVEEHQSRILLAQLFMNEARITGEHGHYYPAAIQLLEYNLEQSDLSDDERFQTLATLASVQLSQHNFEQALATAKAAQQLNPYNAQVYGALVDAHLELGQYEQAVTMADRMVSIRPDLRSYARISYLREVHGDLTGAIEAMRMAVQAGYPGQEQTAWTRLKLAELYRQNSQPDAAAYELQVLLSERPNYPFAITAQAQLAVDKNQDQQAEELLLQAANIIPEVGFYIDLASLYQRQDREEELAAILVEIEDMLADDVASGHNMDMEYAAYYRDLRGDLDKALQYATNEYQKRPDNLDVNRLLASIHQKRGEHELAATLLK